MTSMITSYAKMLQDNYKSKQTLVDQNKQDALRTHVKAYKPLGKLIETNPLNPVEAIKSDIRSVKYFFKGIDGKGNDYSIGRINDIGIKLGGLGIASIIAAGKGSTLFKGMEFVGLASWLGAMSLWQKLAINTPIKYLKGVDLGLEYENSAGHRKKFFGDSQFICWDLLSDEQISEMGDKLGVPKNIMNRRKAVENKARQVAIQGNTLAMLTAGFATPLAASLAADKIGKHVLSPLVTKIKEEKALQKQNEFVRNLEIMPQDTETLKYIRDNFKDVITPEQKTHLKKLLLDKTNNNALKATINDVVDNIVLASESTGSQIVIDEKFNTRLTDMLTKEWADHKSEISRQLTELAEKYKNVLTLDNMDLYRLDLEEWLSENCNKLFDTKDLPTDASLDKIFKESKNVSIGDIKSAKSEFSKLSQILDIYNVKKKNFDDYWKQLSNSEGSVQAKIWNEMTEGLLKAFDIDNKKMTEFIKGFPDKSVTDGTQNIARLFSESNILGDVYDELLANPDKLDRTLRKLSAVMSRTTEQTDKNFQFSLKSLDRIQMLISDVDRNSPIAQLSEKMKMLIAEDRLKVLNNYVVTNETAFFPVRSLYILRNSKEALKKLADTTKMDYEKIYFDFKKLLLSSQTVNEFMNKLKTFDSMINAENYDTFVSTLFSDLPANVSKHIPEELVGRINASAKLSKALLAKLTDGVQGVELPQPENSTILEALKKMNLYKYADELFDINFNNSEYLANRIGNTVRKSNAKLEELQTIIKLSKSDIEKIKNSDFSPIHDMLRGSSSGKGVFEYCRHNFMKILSFFEVNDLNATGDINIIKSKTSAAAELIAPKLHDALARKAKDVYNYNTWFKRVGISFLALCGITAVAISQIGKKNEFNLDTYKERKSA